jgi:heat shock protein HslJ/predicted small secreted protein
LEIFELKHAIHFSAVVATAFLLAACGTARDVAGPDETKGASANAVLKTLQVAPARVECTGVAPQTCLQVRESSAAAWTLLYEEIVGFDYQPGYLYEIRIREEAVANPPADGSAIRRSLVAILSQTSAPALAGPTWRLVTLEGRDALAGVRVTAVFGDDSRVSGSAGCNAYFGRAAVSGEQLTVGLLGTTMMYCGAEGVMAQEAAYHSALEKAKVYRVVDGRLQLGPTADVVTLVYQAE